MIIKMKRGGEEGEPGIGGHHAGDGGVSTKDTRDALV